MAPSTATRTALMEMVEKTNSLACLACGKCTSVCPVATIGKSYSPRITVTRTIRQDFDNLLGEYDLWSCLSCKKCDAYCPADVHYIDLIKILRNEARGAGFAGSCSHAGVLQVLARMMVNPDLKQRRLDWVPKSLKTSPSGEILYFVGCAPYFDTLFTNLEPHTLDAAVSSITILNALGIKPALMAEERCCGHDLYWNGDRANFRRLAEYNLAAVKQTGARTILFSCAECLSAFKELYPEIGLSVDAELKHMSEFLAEKIVAGDLVLAEDDTAVTYQDPCRLGRHLGIYDAPRFVLNSGSNGHLKEMAQHRKHALCCGVSAWMNCGATAKGIQMERLRQVRETGARLLAVACPKCQIHLLCAQKDRKVKEDLGIEIQDIATVTLNRLQPSTRGKG